MDFRKFHEDVKRMAYTVTKIHTHVLLLLIILRSNMYDADADADAAADGEVGLVSWSSFMLSAIETA